MQGELGVFSPLAGAAEGAGLLLWVLCSPGAGEELWE